MNQFWVAASVICQGHFPYLRAEIRLRAEVNSRERSARAAIGSPVNGGEPAPRARRARLNPEWGSIQSQWSPAWRPN
jgi:hypothetical protein